MDEQVIRSLIKWPAVPECFGWLSLDRRGQWRMRNDYAQAHRLAGEIITHRTLIEFIERNYARDTHGQWFFQNGPQRVFIDLDFTPFVTRIHPTEIKTTSGIVINPISCHMDESQHVFIESSITIQRLDSNQFSSTTENILMLLHDHDLGLFARDAQLTNACGTLGTWTWANQTFEIHPISSNEVKERYCLRPESRIS